TYGHTCCTCTGPPWCSPPLDEFLSREGSKTCAAKRNGASAHAAAPRRLPREGDSAGLDELGVDGLDLLLAPLDGLLEIHLVGAELGERIHHHELLVDLVRSRGERARVAGGEVVLGVLLERLQLRVLADDRERRFRVVLEERHVVAGAGLGTLAVVVHQRLEERLGPVLVLGELRHPVGTTVGEGAPRRRTPG